MQLTADALTTSCLCRLMVGLRRIRCTILACTVHVSEQRRATETENPITLPSSQRRNFLVTPALHIIK